MVFTHVGACRLLGISIVVAVAVSACKKESDAPASEVAAKPASAADGGGAGTTADAGAVAAATPGSGTEDRPSPACVAPIDDAAPPQPVRIGERAATKRGHRLTFTEADADSQLVLGVLGPVNEDSPENLFNLDRYLKFFEEQKADAIVFTGDIAEVAEGITRVVNHVASKAKLPVFVIIGNRECEADFSEGIAASQREHSNVVNLNQHRVVELGGVTMIALPGYHDPNFINCTTGCRYTRATVEETIRLAKATAGKPTLLVSHGPPRGEGTQAIDYAVNGGNVGDKEINRALVEGGIKFAVFSNIKEAGGKATDESFNTVVAEGKPAKTIYLNAGAADATVWDMNDRTRSHGQAAVLTIKGEEGTFKMYRSKPLTAAEKKAIKKAAASK